MKNFILSVMSLAVIPALLSSCTEKPLPIVEKVDMVRYVKCLTLSQKEMSPLSRIKKECRLYATVTNDPSKPSAIAKCTSFKQGELGWTDWEIKKYCTVGWRGYR